MDKPGDYHGPLMSRSVGGVRPTVNVDMPVCDYSKNYVSHPALRHCVNMAPVCRTKGKSVWRWVETQLETEKTFWENCQCLRVLTALYNRYMVKQTSTEALWLEY